MLAERPTPKSKNHAAEAMLRQMRYPTLEPADVIPLCVTCIIHTHFRSFLLCLLTAEARDAAERLSRRQSWATKVLIEVENDLQGIAASQVGQRSCGFLETD